MRWKPAIFAAALLGVALFAHAEDWPRWRGPKGDGISIEKNLADSWPAAGPPAQSLVADRRHRFLQPRRPRRKNLFLLPGSRQGHPPRLRRRQGHRPLGPVLRPRPRPAIPRHAGHADDRRRPHLHLRQRRRSLLPQPRRRQARLERQRPQGDRGPTHQLGPGVQPSGHRGHRLCPGRPGRTAEVAVDKKPARSPGSPPPRPPAATPRSSSPMSKNNPSSSPSQANRSTASIQKPAPQSGPSSWRTQYDVNAATPIYQDGRLFVTSEYGHGCMMLTLSAKGAKKEWETREVQSKIQPPILDGKAASLRQQRGHAQVRQLARRQSALGVQRQGAQARPGRVAPPRGRQAHHPRRTRHAQPRARHADRKQAHQPGADVRLRPGLVQPRDLPRQALHQGAG